MCPSQTVLFVSLLQYLHVSICKQYPFLEHSSFNKLSESKSIHNNISITSSPNCPITSNPTTVQKICITDSPNQALDGEYKLLYNNTNGSVYSNSQIHESMYPYITSSMQYQYHIEKYLSSTTTISARCNLTSNDFDISDCIGKWELFDNNNNEWIFDPNIISKHCQDICIHGNDHSFITDGSMAIYSHFNNTRNTNIYYCHDCNDGIDNIGGYIYGWILSNGDYYWLIGSDFNDGKAYSTCYLGNNLDSDYSHDYYFDIDDCLEKGRWHSYDYTKSGWINDVDKMIYKCNFEMAQEICMELGGDQIFNKMYNINGIYQGFAVGFDLNTMNLDKDVFIVQYSCDGMEYDELMRFDGELNINNIIYSLSSEICDYAKEIGFKFMVDGIGLNGNHVFIDDLYLYYDVNDVLYFDDMNDGNNWIEIGAVIAGYQYEMNLDSMNISDGKTYRLYIPFPENNDIASITRIISMNMTEYQYKDLNLEWSMITNSLSEGTMVNIEVECDDDVSYINDLCILKQYNSNNDCIDSLCSIQSYNLPSECEYSSEITVRFYLKSSVSTDEIYIDYVSLTHSNSFGNDAELCAVITSSPTLSPTMSPVNIMNTTQHLIYIIETDPVSEDVDSSKTDDEEYWLYGLIVVVGLFIIVAILWYIELRRKANKEDKGDMNMKEKETEIPELIDEHRSLTTLQIKNVNVVPTATPMEDTQIKTDKSPYTG